jgi:hypothetical protein
VSQVIKVFLASPGGLETERAMSSRIVERINQVLGPFLAVHLSLYRWENEPPGFGRPQGLINPAVHDCDIFVGIVGRRWGSPTGEYESGFAEEYAVATERARNTGIPSVLLFCREIDPEAEADPGPQLEKVLAFKAERRRLHDVMYKEYADEGQWAEEFHVALMREVLKARPDHKAIVQALIEDAAARWHDFTAPSTPFTRTRINLEGQWVAAFGFNTASVVEEANLALALWTDYAVAWKCVVTDPDGRQYVHPRDEWMPKEAGERFARAMFPSDFEWAAPDLLEGNYLIEWWEPSQQPGEHYRLARDGVRYRRVVDPESPARASAPLT